MATMSILGLYNYDNTIFDGLSLPTAADITNEADKVSDPFVPDKTDFIKYLCLECAELELVYPSAPVMAEMIEVWSDARKQTWKELYNTFLYKYNPIWNKDGTKRETRDLEIIDDYAVTNMKTDHDGNVTHEVTGYDTSTYSPDTRQTIDTTDNVNGGTKNTHTEDGYIEWTEGGNIGVTMTQEMIRQQREIISVNFYDHLVDEFKSRFCLLIY